PATHAQYTLCLKHLRTLVDPQLARDLTTGLIDDFTALRRQKVRAATVNGDLRVIRAMCRWAKEHKLLHRLPKIKSLPEPEKLPVVVHDFETKVLAVLDKVKLSRCSPQWWRVYLKLAHSLG